jgi:hypothetical protein
MSGKLHCAFCGDFLGVTEVPLLMTGIVKIQPFMPDGLRYVRCERCDHYHRYEIITPDKAKETLAKTTPLMPILARDDELTR